MVTSRVIADAVDVRRLLVASRDRPVDALPTYGEVAGVCGRAPNGLGELLEYIYRDCLDHDEPDLTAMVINKQTRMPGKFGGRYAVSGQMDTEAWLSMLERIRTYDWPRDAAPAPSS
jgi:hypothetical protein